jgi:lipoate-protein ligase A
MAVDEAIVESCRESGTPVATVRLYAFRPAALSLGKGQPASEASEPAVLRGMGIDLVRRPTGGRAVLHDRERTYAVIGRLGRAPFDAGVVETYRRIAAALEAALGRVGVEARATEPGAGAYRVAPRAASCFAAISSYEIAVRGRKLVGSAQLRRGGALLQHGSSPWRADAERLGRALRDPIDPGAFTDLERAAGGALDSEALDRALVRGFEERFGVELEPGELSEREALLAARLRCWKYLSAGWTLGGRIGARERAHGPGSSSE